MAQGIQVPIVADVAQSVTGVRRLGDEFDKVADTLDDVGREGKASGDKLERSFQEAFAEIRRDSKRMGDDVARDTREAVTGRGGEAVAEFKNEARQNFSEVASSFSGGVDGAADLVQGTLGGLAASLPGPVGIASGLLAGIGGALWASMDDNAGKTEQRIQDMFDNLLESGLNYLSDQAVSEGIAAIYQGSEDAAISLAKAQEYAELLGIDVGTVVAAFAGSQRAQNEWNDAIARGRDEAQRLADTAAQNPMENQALAAVELWDALDGAAGAMGNVTGELDKARERVQGARDAQEQWTEAGRRAAAEAERQADATQAIQDRYRALEGQTFYGPRVQVQADATELDRELARPRTIKVGVAARPGTQVVI